MSQEIGVTTSVSMIGPRAGGPDGEGVGSVGSGSVGSGSGSVSKLTTI